MAGSATGNIMVNNTYTNFTSVTVGSWNNRVWRNTDKTECIYGYQVVNTSNSDYRPTVAGTQYIEFNDIAYGGFGSNLLRAAYFKPNVTYIKSVYRAGRTFTAVQHKVNGYPAQPLTVPAYFNSINGVNVGACTPTAEQVSASINTNWVNFTFYVNAMTYDSFSYANSPWIYVYTTSCPQGNTFTLTTTANAVRLRQTSQDGSRPFIEVALPAFVPPGGNVAPAPIIPF